MISPTTSRPRILSWGGKICDHSTGQAIKQEINVLHNNKNNKNNTKEPTYIFNIQLIEKNLSKETHQDVPKSHQTSPGKSHFFLPN